MAGLYGKYRVTKVSDGSEVGDCFVLKPVADKHARAALLAYADSVETDNPALAVDLRKWLSWIASTDETR